jgi:hypothetical protein
VLPFEVLSMLLLAALIGAIVLARRESGESGEEAHRDPHRARRRPIRG